MRLLNETTATCDSCGHTEPLAPRHADFVPHHRAIYHSQDFDPHYGGVRHSAVPVPGVEYRPCEKCGHCTDVRLTDPVQV